jgi:cytoskeleton protein RodZ
MAKESKSADDAQGQPVTLALPDETLGGFLKRQRQGQGKSLEEIAEKTHIHASTLRAIEEDNPKALPAEVFTRGFVRNYAQYLGLDPIKVLGWYIEQNAGEVRPTEDRNVQEVLAGEIMAEAWTFPLGRLIVFLLVVGAFLLAGYLMLDFLNSSALPISIYKKEVQTQTLVNQVPPLVAQNGESHASRLSEADSKSDKRGQAENQNRPEIVQMPPVAAVVPVISATKAREAHYVLEAKFLETTWVSVQIDKEKKKSVTYQSGDHEVWEAEKNISLLVGNAGGVVLTLNGKPLPSLGKSMQIGRISLPAE